VQSPFINRRYGLCKCLMIVRDSVIFIVQCSGISFESVPVNRNWTFHFFMFATVLGFLVTSFWVYGYCIWLWAFSLYEWGRFISLRLYYIAQGRFYIQRAFLILMGGI
jgi:hypothetical protein